MTTQNPNTRRGIMSGCEYAINSLQNIKKMLMYPDPDQEITAWAFGGLLTTLVAYLLVISQDIVFNGNGESAKDDLLEIKRQFNEFIDRMLDND